MLFTGVAVASLNNHSVFAYSPSDLQKLNTTGSCPGCDLSGADLSKRKFTGANLKGANLSNANLTGTQFIESDLRGINVTGAAVSKTYIWKGLVAADSFSSEQKLNRAS
ncbi:pentapeptide repeat-containing protein [Vulcanococcus limneticus]|uniref:pentapeptide repeat-containing protein n=1 Tax=Vulcanococcus limneticus TaxID=2170428 RepID=UPI000B98FC26